jgi:hypothetical protein
MVREGSYHHQLIVEKRKGKQVNMIELKDGGVKPARGHLHLYLNLLFQLRG